MSLPDLLPGLLDAATLARRRHRSGWTCKHEPASTPGMTLIIAAHARTGEIVLAADRRTSGSSEDGESVVVQDDLSPKLTEFDGAAIAISGTYATAQLVVRDFIATDKRDEKSVDRLAERLREAYQRHHGDDRQNWPGVRVTYCDWYRRGRILLLRSRVGFAPEEPGLEPHLSGSTSIAHLVHQLFGLGRSTVEHIERYCLLAFAYTSKFDTSVGNELDFWLLGEKGITRRTPDEMRATGAAVGDSLEGLRERLYP